MGAEVDESEVVISQDTFEKKVEIILGKMAEFFFYKNKSSSKKTVEQIVRSHYGNNVAKHQVSDEESYDAIPLGHFVKDLAENIGVKVDTLDIYCIFTKLKYSENYETIDIDKIIQEMKQFNTEDDALDLNISPEKKRGEKLEAPLKFKEAQNVERPEEDDLFANLNKFLKDKGMLFDDLLIEFDKLIRVENNIKLMAYSDFISLMCSSNIISSPNLSSKTLSLISDSPEFINLSNLKNILSKMKTVRPMSGIGTRNNNNTKKKDAKDKEDNIKQISNINEDDLDQVNISNDVPNSSKILNESLNGDKFQLKETKKQSPANAKKRPPSAMKKNNVSNNKSTDRYDEKEPISDKYLKDLNFFISLVKKRIKMKKKK